MGPVFKNVVISALAVLPLLFAAVTSSAQASSPAPRAIFAQQDLIAIQVYFSPKNLYDKVDSLLSLHANGFTCDFEVWADKDGSKLFTVTLYKVAKNGAIESHDGWAYSVDRDGSLLHLENNKSLETGDAIALTEAAALTISKTDKDKIIYISSATHFQTKRLNAVANAIGGAKGLLKLRTLCHQVQMSKAPSK